MKLTRKEIGYFATEYKDATSISIFSNINDKPDGSEINSLTEKGILQGNKCTQEAQDILTVLANTEKSTRLLIENAYCIIEKYSYKYGDKIVLAENDNGEFKFSLPDDFSDVIVDVSEFIGMSKISSSNISLVLTPDEMILLLVLIDCYRKRFLQEYSEIPEPSINVSKSDWSKALEFGFKNGLAQVLVKNYNFVIPDKNSLDSIIKSLVEKKVVIKKNGFRLNEDFEFIARNFLILENLIMYETFTIQKDASLLTVGRLGVSAGIHNLMSFMFDGENIQLNTISGLQLVTNIEDFLKCPEIKSSAEEVESQTNDYTWKCSCGENCDTKFCSNCGNKRP